MAEPLVIDSGIAVKWIIDEPDSTSAERILDRYSLNEIVIETISSFSLFESAFSIAVNHRRTFYDSLYLAASSHLGCKFVTADERLYNSTRASFPNIILLSDWPE